MARKAKLTLTIGDMNHDIDLTLEANRSDVRSDALPDENIWLSVDGERVGSLFITRDGDDVQIGLGRFCAEERGWDHRNPINERDEALAFEAEDDGE